jgi:hypothetical protein
MSVIAPTWERSNTYAVFLDLLLLDLVLVGDVSALGSELLGQF